jgi:Dickkopf N-terminal cysteine-rich region
MRTQTYVFGALGVTLLVGLPLAFFYRCSNRTDPSEHKSRSIKWSVSPSSGGSSSPIAPPQRLAEELCEALHVLPGRRVAQCCGTPPSRFFYEECVRVTSQALLERTIEISSTSLASCARATTEALTGCDWVKPGQPLAPAACQGIVQGRQREGQVCRSSLECHDGLHCSRAESDGAGRCAAPEPVGTACGSGVDTFATYALEHHIETRHPICKDFCSVATHRCAPIPSEGAACQASVNCAPGQSCSAGKCSTEGVQRALSSPGESCKSDFDCKVGGCVPHGDEPRVCGKQCAVSLQRTL